MYLQRKMTNGAGRLANLRQCFHHALQQRGILQFNSVTLLTFSYARPTATGGYVLYEVM